MSVRPVDDEVIANLEQYEDALIRRESWLLDRGLPVARVGRELERVQAALVVLVLDA
jgi:hypothetical protein